MKKILACLTMTLFVLVISTSCGGGKKAEAPTQKAYAELLLGKWQSIDDADNFLIFDKNLRKEIAPGMTEWDEENYVLSDRCKNEKDKFDNADMVHADRYITCEKSDMCWYIIDVDQNTLSLSYMGRGNTLNYKKVKE